MSGKVGNHRGTFERNYQHRPTHVRVTGIDNFQQDVEGEEFVTRDLGKMPFNWAENHRLGDGTMGISAIAGLRVVIESGKGVLLSEGILSLEGVMNRMGELDGNKSDGIVELEDCEGHRSVGVEYIFNVDPLSHLQRTHKGRDGLLAGGL